MNYTYYINYVSLSSKFFSPSLGIKFPPLYNNNKKTKTILVNHMRNVDTLWVTAEKCKKKEEIRHERARAAVIEFSGFLLRMNIFIHSFSSWMLFTMCRSHVILSLVRKASMATEWKSLIWKLQFISFYQFELHCIPIRIFENSWDLVTKNYFTDDSF